MAKIINTVSCSDNYDLVFTDNGHISVETATSSSVANLLKFDFFCNDNWSLDSDLGLHWVSEKNDGLLQIKNSELQIVNAINRKLLDTPGVIEVVEININKGIGNSLSVYAKVKTDDNQYVEVRKEA